MNTAAPCGARRAAGTGREGGGSNRDAGLPRGAAAARGLFEAEDPRDPAGSGAPLPCPLKNLNEGPCP